jgi:anti-sigma factor ChrR (cupin superfamily)
MRQFSTEDVTRLQKLSWRRHRVPGVKYALLRLNLLKREIVVLLQGEAGTRYPLHRHRGVEEIFMLAGDLAIDGKTYRVGDYIRSKAGSTHALQTRTGCLCFVRTVLGEEFLEEIPAVT